MGQTRNLRDGQITIKDNGANSLVLTIDQGDLSFSEKRNTIEVMDRGTLDHTRPGDDVSVELSFSIKVDRVSDATTVTLRDALTGTRSASSWASTSGAHEQYTTTVEFVANDPTGGADDETITFSKVYVESIDFSEGDEFNTLEVSGKAFVTAPTYS